MPRKLGKWKIGPPTRKNLRELSRQCAISIEAKKQGKADRIARFDAREGIVVSDWLKQQLLALPSTNHEINPDSETCVVWIDDEQVTVPIGLNEFALRSFIGTRQKVYTLKPDMNGKFCKVGFEPTKEGARYVIE